MFLDNSWNEISDMDLKNRLKNNKIYIFGLSTRNKRLQSVIDKETSIVSVMDNNRELWNIEKEGYFIQEPKRIDDGIIISVLNDYKRLIPQFKSLNMKEWYFYFDDNEYNTKYKKYFDYFVRDNNRLIKRVPIRQDISFVHFINDEKFFSILLDMLEESFSIEEHLFVVHSINAAGLCDCYHLWDRLNNLYDQYNNVFFIDDYLNFNMIDYEEELTRLDELLSKCSKIILHGEFLPDLLQTYLHNKRNYLMNCGVWIPWSDPTDNKVVINNISNVLQFCAVRVAGKKGKETFTELYKEHRPVHINDVLCTYVPHIEDIDVIEKNHNKSIEILIGNSARFIDRVKEAVELIGRFANEDIKVYIILSYGVNGNKEKAEELEKMGYRIFGEKFCPIKDFIENKNYVEFLSKKDIYVCTSSIGGVTTIQMMLNLGKKVFVRDGSRMKTQLEEVGYGNLYSYNNIINMSFEDFVQFELDEAGRMKSKGALDYENCVNNWKLFLGL